MHIYFHINGLIFCQGQATAMPVLQSVASNVESSLAFTLSVKIVDIINSMNAESSSGVSGVHSFDPVITLCTIVVFMTLLSCFEDTASGPKGSARTPQATSVPAGWIKDVRSIATHILVLAFSRYGSEELFLKLTGSRPSPCMLQMTCFESNNYVLLCWILADTPSFC